MSENTFQKAKGKEFKTNVTINKVAGKEYYRISIPPRTAEIENLRDGSKIRVKILEVDF